MRSRWCIIVRIVCSAIGHTARDLSQVLHPSSKQIRPRTRNALSLPYSRPEYSAKPSIFLPRLSPPVIRKPPPSSTSSPETILSTAISSSLFSSSSYSYYPRDFFIVHAFSPSSYFPSVIVLLLILLHSAILPSSSSSASTILSAVPSIRSLSLFLSPLSRERERKEKLCNRSAIVTVRTLRH